MPQLARREYEDLEKELKILDQELSQIDNTYSWKDYELPDSEKEARKDLENLLPYAQYPGHEP